MVEELLVGEADGDRGLARVFGSGSGRCDDYVAEQHPQDNGLVNGGDEIHASFVRGGSLKGDGFVFQCLCDNPVGGDALFQHFDFLGDKSVEDGILIVDGMVD